VALGAAPLSASAQTQGGAQPDGAAQLQQIAYDWLQPALAAAMGQADTGALRPEIVLGALDSRLRLAECYRVEPYLPPGTRLWGRSRIGLRCVDGPVRWNVFLPVTVRAWGPAWVLKRPVTAGSILVQEDADIAEIDNLPVWWPIRKAGSGSRRRIRCRQDRPFARTWSSRCRFSSPAPR